MAIVFIESYLMILTRRILYFRGSVIILASFLCFAEEPYLENVCPVFFSLPPEKIFSGERKTSDSRIKFKVVNLIREMKIFGCL